MKRGRSPPGGFFLSLVFCWLCCANQVVGMCFTACAPKGFLSMVAVTQSAVIQIAEGTAARNFKAIAPIIFCTAELSAAGVVGVRGSLPYQVGDEMKQLDLDDRWLTLPMSEAKELLETAIRDNTVHAIRVSSRVAGNMYGIGSEPALLCELTGSKEAAKLAEKYHLDYSETNPVGTEGILVTHTNPVMFTLQAAAELLGSLQFPTLEKSQGRTSRADTSNPNYFAALAVVDATGKLPPRQFKSFARINTSFADRFEKPEPRRYNRVADEI